MTSLFAFANPFALAAPPASPDTVHVTSSYVLNSGDAIAFDGNLGFKLVVRDSASISLEIGGIASVDGGDKHDRAVGVLTTDSINGDAQIQIDDTGTLQVSIEAAGGQAAGVIVNSVGSSFGSDGLLQVSAIDGVAIGVQTGAQDVTLDNTGTIQVTGAILAEGMVGGADFCALTNSGIIAVSGAEAGGMVFSGGDGQIDNNGRVEVTGTDATGFAVGLAGTALGTVTNDGVVKASGLAFAIGVEAVGSSDFTNNGVITAVSSGGDALAIGCVIVGGTVENTGTVHAAIAMSSADLLGGVGVGFAAAETVTNSGKLTGLVQLGADDDSLTNDRQIHGDVNMGDDADLFDGRLGRVTGVVEGGLGDDVLIGGRHDDTLFGDNKADAGAGGDDLLRGLKGHDKINGGFGDDTLTGGKGGDHLTGGAGDDVFNYVKLSDSTVASSDRITDLAANDRIDLHAIDADTITGGDQAFHLVGAFSGAAGELTLSYDVGSNTTTLAGDVNGDGAADFQVLLTGDQTGFTDFAL